MNTLRCSIALFTLGLAAAAGQAQSVKLQPGLWEQTMTVKSASGEMESQMAQMQQQLASMPPDQRKMVEDMMARQGAGMGPGKRTVRICLSPEQAARADLPQQEGDCAGITPRTLSR